MQVTRQRIVDFLRKQNKATVEELTKVIGLTHMAVRHHLNILQREGLVEVSTTRRVKKPGRPVQIYALTQDAEKLYPQDYFKLSDLLLEEITNYAGSEGVATIFHNMAEQLLAVAPEPQDRQPFEDRLDDVVCFLKEKGFVVKWEIEDGRYVIHHMACPYHQLASRHSAVCLLDELLIESMLEVRPRRTCCIADNDEKCTYYLDLSPSMTKSQRPVELIEQNYTDQKMKKK